MPKYVAISVFSSSCGRFSGLNLSSELASGCFECGVWSQPMWFTGSRTLHYKDLKQHNKVFQAGHQGNSCILLPFFHGKDKKRQWLHFYSLLYMVVTGFRIMHVSYTKNVNISIRTNYFMTLALKCFFFFFGDDTLRWNWNRVHRSSIWTMYMKIANLWWSV